MSEGLDGSDVQMSDTLAQSGSLPCALIFPSLLEWISKGNEQDSAKERNSCGSNFDGCKNLIPSGDRGKTHEAGEKGRRVGGGHVVGRLA